MFQGFLGIVLWFSGHESPHADALRQTGGGEGSEQREGRGRGSVGSLSGFQGNSRGFRKQVDSIDHTVRYFGIVKSYGREAVSWDWPLRSTLTGRGLQSTLAGCQEGARRRGRRVGTLEGQIPTGAWNRTDGGVRW